MSNDCLRIIFLDIDGVLNGSGDTDLVENTFSKSRLDLFQRLYEELGENVLVVITSDRRIIEAERNTIDKVFEEYKIEYTYLSTKRTYPSRAEEILDYLENFKDVPEVQFVILDDNDYGYTTNTILRDRFINTRVGAFNTKIVYKVHLLI